jgi:hypothetical protein
MPYVRLDVQNEHFGPAWVCLDFSIIVTFSGFASFWDRLPDVFAFRAVFRPNMHPGCLLLAI